MFDYRHFRREALAAFSHIGQAITSEEAERRMTAAQIKRRRAKNFMTEERWQYRALAGDGCGPVVVEVSYGYFIDKPLIGLTVFHSLPEHAERNHDASGCLSTIEEAAAALRKLNGDDE